jgi:hypothetical protein
MEEYEMEDGDWKYVIDSEKDSEIYNFLVMMADKHNVELESPEFNEMVNTMLSEALADEVFLKRVKKLLNEEENSEKD